jgi:hypothetical protein
MNPPNTISCDGETVHIESVNHMLPNRLNGTYRQNKIRLNVGVHSDVRRMVLWHELLHHAAERGGLETSAQSVERVLDAIDSFSLAMLRENPRLVEYLLG